MISVFRVLVVPGALALAGAGFLWWYHSRTKTSKDSEEEEMEDTGLLTGEGSEHLTEGDQEKSVMQLQDPVSSQEESAIELPEKVDDDQCAQSEIEIISSPISTRAPVSHCSQDLQLQDISQPAEGCEEKIQLQDPVSSHFQLQDIVDISKPVEGCEDPVSSQEEPGSKDIAASSSPCEDDQVAQPVIEIKSTPISITTEELQLQDKVDISQPAEKSKSSDSPGEGSSTLGQWAKPLDLSKLLSKTPFRRTDEVEMITEIEWKTKVPALMVGKFVGTKGKHLQSIMCKSGADIKVSPLKQNKTFWIISVKGLELQVKAAKTLIRKWCKLYNLPCD